MESITSMICAAVPADQLAFMQCQVLCIVFAELYHRLIHTLKAPTIKHAYNFAISNILLVTLLGGLPVRVFLHIYAPVLITYTWSVRCKGSPWPLTMAMFAQLAWSHWNKMQERYLNYNLDQTVVLMLMTVKLSSFAFDQWDTVGDGVGERKDEIGHGDVGMMEFMGYAFLFPGFVSGPAIMFPQYRAFINTTTAISAGRHQMAVRQIVMAIAFGVGHVLLKPLFNVDTLLTEWYRQLPLSRRLVYLHIANMCSRFMYYTAWLMAESSLIIMGFPRDCIQIVNPWRIESASDPRQILQNWNITTDRWLHRHFYVRMRAPLGASLANVAVKMVSAVWHGFYPGYYCMFASYGLVSSCSRQIYRRFRCPIREGLARRVVLWVPCWLVVDYVMPPFVLLTWHKSVAWYRQSLWWGHIACLLVILVSRVITRVITHSHLTQK